MKPAVKSVVTKVRELSAGSFVKGLLLTAVAVVGVMALVGGFLGANDALNVGGVAARTFESGMGVGIDTAFKFLTSGMGLLTLGVGGAVGIGAEVLGNQKKLAAEETERLKLEHQRIREQQLSQEIQKLKHKDKHHHHDHSHEKHTQERETVKKTVETKETKVVEAAAPAPEKAQDKTLEKAPEKKAATDSKDGIYVAGSVIKEKNFRAAELKRRTDRDFSATASVSVSA